jgi:hypothetical protein
MTTGMASGAEPQSSASRMLQVAWLAVLLGLAIQLLILAGRFIAGANPSLAGLLADVCQSVCWSFMVCGGIAIGMLLHEGRIVIAGMLGFVSGPIAWGTAKAAQRLVQSLLGVPVDQIGDFFYLLCALKGIEYFVLGVLVARLTGRDTSTLRDYAMVGFVVGIVSTIVVVYLSVRHGVAVGQPMPFPKIVGLALGELTFPIGCALVIYAPFHFKRQLGLA